MKTRYNKSEKRKQKEMALSENINLHIALIYYVKKNDKKKLQNKKNKKFQCVSI